MNSFRDIYKPNTVRDRNWILPFGKYKSLPLHEVMKNDPGYLEFMQGKGYLDLHSDLWDEMREMFQAECDRYLHRSDTWNVPNDPMGVK